MRYKMIIAYDGSYYHGFQRQLNLISVQSELERVFTYILKTEVVVKSAGRTDAGVHAYGQVIHFDSEQEVPPKNLKKVANKMLYPHIYIRTVEIVDRSFHSRVSAKTKEYRYYLSIGEFNPIEANYKHFFHPNIDIEKIKEAMTYIVGTHDFKSFSKNHKIKNTTRTILLFELKIKDNELEFRIIGNGFMHNMVRIIIALMLKIGEGKRNIDEIKDIFEGKDRSLVPYIAPANGLYLWEVTY